MVTYDFSGEDVNPWALETWSLTEQGKFLKRMSDKYGAKFGMMRAQAFASLVGSKVGATRPAPPKPQVYILKGRPGPPGKDGTSGSGAPSNPILGFTAEGPLTSVERFALAPAAQAIKFPAALAALSTATCLFVATNDTTLVLTADPDEYLSSGGGVICAVTFRAGSQIGSFAWGAPLVVPASTPLYIVAPVTADLTLGGISILFRGDAA